MNIYDSHLMSLLLEKSGYQKTNAIEKSDIIIINTCSVRDHAVNRALSRISSLKYLKIKNPHLRIGVTGCIPQQMKDTLKEELITIKEDFELGVDSIRNIEKEENEFVKVLTQIKQVEEKANSLEEISDDEFYKIYEKENPRKKSIWRGKETKGFIEWKKKYLEI